MKKRVTALISLAIMIMLLAIGFFVLVHAATYGLDAANAAVRANGGSMDTGEFNMTADAVIKSYQIIGGIILTIGGLGILLSGCALYKQL